MLLTGLFCYTSAQGCRVGGRSENLGGHKEIEGILKDFFLLLKLQKKFLEARVPLAPLPRLHATSPWVTHPAGMDLNKSTVLSKPKYDHHRIEANPDAKGFRIAHNKNPNIRCFSPF